LIIFCYIIIYCRFVVDFEELYKSSWWVVYCGDYFVISFLS